MKIILVAELEAFENFRNFYLEPFSLHQSLEPSDSPAGRIKNNLSQRGHLEGGVCPLCTVNEY